MSRILSVWLPSWPTQRLNRLRGAPADAAPLATITAIRGVRRLAAVCPRAAAFGLRPDQTLAQARAVCPRLDAVDADPTADGEALSALAAWCERLTPLAAPDPTDGLWLDIDGCDHHFNGETLLATKLSQRLAQTGLSCRVAVAGTTGAAWALAREMTAGPVTVVPRGKEVAALAMLPVGLLRIDGRTAAGLRRLGLRTIGDIDRLPRGELTTRFGAAVLTRLDQALGRATEAIPWPRTPALWEERLAFAEPIGTADDFSRALQILSERICVRLTAAGLGGLRFTATFFRVDEQRPTITIATALPTRNAARLTTLLRGKIETVDPGFGVETVTLAAEAIAPLGTPQVRLPGVPCTLVAGSDAGYETRLETTVDKMANRLGPNRVWRTAPADSHVPERAIRRVPPLTRPIWELDPSMERPVRLFRRPEQIDVTAPVPDDPPVLFRWRGALHRVRGATGPERISAEWWRLGGAQLEKASEEPSLDRPEIDRVRDYYRVEDSAGSRFWIFRAGLNRGGLMPRWFLHGLFG